MTANNNKKTNNSNEGLPVQHEGTFKPVESVQVNDPALPQNGAPPMPRQLDLNDVVMDLKTISNLCSQKVVEYSDISAIFKQISQVTNNLSLGMSIYLKERGELDPKRFKLQEDPNQGMIN